MFITITRNLFKLKYAQRCYSSLHSFRYLELDCTSQDGYSILKMHRKPVNSFNMEFIDELSRALDLVESLPDTRGLVLTSNLKVFSAGLDLFELYSMQQHEENGVHRMKRFLTLIQDFGLRLYQSPLVTIAALNGPAPAGGCAISLSCDYRVMVDNQNFSIGLNETLVGLTVPNNICKLYSSLIGQREAERHLVLGTLFSPDKALKLGLVDAVVPSEELMSTVDKIMRDSLSVSDFGRIKCKEMMHGGLVDHEGSEEYMEWIIAALHEPEIQQIIGNYIKALQGVKKLIVP